MQKCPFYGVKEVKRWLFDYKLFLKIWIVVNLFNENSNFAKTSFQNRSSVNFFVRNLTRCKLFISKSYMSRLFYFKTWLVVYISIQSFICSTNFSLKIWGVLKISDKSQRKSVFFIFKTWRVVKIFFQNLTSCMFFNSKSENLWFFYITFRHDQIYIFKVKLLKKHKNRKIFQLSGVERKKTWFFEGKVFCKIFNGVWISGKKLSRYNFSDSK